MRPELEAFAAMLPPDYRPVMTPIGALTLTARRVQAPNVRMMRRLQAITMGDVGGTVAADAASDAASGIGAALSSAQNGGDAGSAIGAGLAAAGAAALKQGVAAASGSSSSSSSSTTAGTNPLAQKVYDQMWDGTAAGIQKLKASADGKKSAVQVQGMARVILRNASTKPKVSTTPFKLQDGSTFLARTTDQLPKLQALQASLGRAPSRTEAFAALGRTGTIANTRSGLKTTTAATTSTASTSLPLMAALAGGAIMLAKTLTGG